MVACHLVTNFLSLTVLQLCSIIKYILFRSFFLSFFFFFIYEQGISVDKGHQTWAAFLRQMRLVMLNFSGNSSLLFSDNEFTDNWQLPENYKPHAYLGIVHGIAFTALKSYELWLFVCLASTERICTHQMLKSFAWESLSCEVMGVTRYTARSWCS